MKTAVLTGATGFLGFALLNELIENGVYVYALCRSNSRNLSRLDGLSGVRVVESDLDHLEIIEDIKNCDAFYHLAWEGNHGDFDIQYKNVILAINCLKLAANLGCRRFICAGSQAEYGNTTDLITEETLLKPTTAYGACKAAAFYLTSDLARRLNIEHSWIRIFSVYGPNDRPSVLILSLLTALKQTGRAALATNGEHIWNYLYVEDAARALRLLGENKLACGVFNLASRINKPLKNFVDEAKAIISASSIITYSDKESEVNLNVSTKKIHRVIGEFERVKFCDGIEKIIELHGQSK